jgi:2-dehydropantoate 2-reductase
MRVMVVGPSSAITAPLVAALGLAKKEDPKALDIFLLARDGSDSTKAMMDPEQGITVRYDPTVLKQIETDDKTRPSNLGPGDTLLPPYGKIQITPDLYTLSSDPKDFDDPRPLGSDAPARDPNAPRMGKPMDILVVGLPANQVTVDKYREYKEAGLIGPNTVIVAFQNGAGVWLPQTVQFERAGITHIEAVDPGGQINAEFGEHLAGAFTAAAARMDEENGKPVPASSFVTGLYPWIVGMPRGHDENSPKAVSLKKFVGFLQKGKLNAQYNDKGTIGKNSFLKWAGNAALNGISAIADASLHTIVNTPELADRARAVMREVRKVALHHGIISKEEDLDIEKRLQDAGKMLHKPSMWAAIFKTKMWPEIEALMGGLIELAGKDVAVPETRALYEEVRELALSRGLVPDREAPMRPLGSTTPDAVAAARAGFQQISKLAA